MTGPKDRLDLWTGKFGDEYAVRNLPQEGNILARVHWLLTAFDEARPWPESVFEVGCGTGANLAALRRIAPSTSRHGCEPNERALGFAIQNAATGIDDTPISGLGTYPGRGFSLVMTCGVLIHVPPAGLGEALDHIVRMAKYHVLVAEYFAPQEEEIPYRGEAGALWRRDYGSLLRDRSDVEYVSHGFLWKPVDGMDNLTWWLFKKRG